MHFCANYFNLSLNKALVENGKEKFEDLHKSILVIPTRILPLFQSMRLM